MYYSLYSADSMKTIWNITKCRKPCKYKAYKLTQPILTKYDDYSFADYDCPIGIWVSSPVTTVETEVFLYPWTSLVAEFGGTLGLFMGFSFMTLWNGVEMLLKVVGSMSRPGV